MEPEEFKDIQLVGQEIHKCKNCLNKFLKFGDQELVTIFKNFIDDIKNSIENGDMQKTLELIKTIKEKRVFINDQDIRARKEQHLNKMKKEKTRRIEKEKDILKCRLQKAVDIREGLFDYNVDENLFKYLTVRQVVKIINKSGIINQEDQLYRSIISAARKAARWFDVCIDRRDDNKEVACTANLLTVSKVLEYLEKNPPAMYDFADSYHWDRRVQP